MHKPAVYDEDGHVIHPKYDPGEFLVAPTDSRGISYRLTFRASPDLVRAIDQIIQSHRFPLTTRGDLLRFATREAVRTLEQMEPIPSVSKRVDILSLILTEEQAHGEFLHVFDQLQRTITSYLADQAGAGGTGDQPGHLPVRADAAGALADPVLEGAGRAVRDDSERAFRAGSG